MPTLKITDNSKAIVIYSLWNSDFIQVGFRGDPSVAKYTYQTPSPFIPMSIYYYCYTDDMTDNQKMIELIQKIAKNADKEISLNNTVSHETQLCQYTNTSFVTMGGFEERYARRYKAGQTANVSLLTILDGITGRFYRILNNALLHVTCTTEKPWNQLFHDNPEKRWEVASLLIDAGARLDTDKGRPIIHMINGSAPVVLIMKAIEMGAWIPLHEKKLTDFINKSNHTEKTVLISTIKNQLNSHFNKLLHNSFDEACKNLSISSTKLETNKDIDALKSKIYNSAHKKLSAIFGRLDDKIINYQIKEIEKTYNVFFNQITKLLQEPLNIDAINADSLTQETQKICSSFGTLPASCSNMVKQILVAKFAKQIVERDSAHKNEPSNLRAINLQKEIFKTLSINPEGQKDSWLRKTVEAEVKKALSPQSNVRFFNKAPSITQLDLEQQNSKKGQCLIM